MKKKPNILLTGSSGMIGTRLFEILREKQYEVMGFDRRKNQWIPSLNEFTIEGDLLHKQDLEKVPLGIDLIIHLAANARVYDLVEDPDLALENMIATHNVLEFARLHNIQHVIFSGSREVYGNAPIKRFKEEEVDMSLCESPYAASKISNEALVYAFSKCYGISYIVFRLSNVYGRYDISDRFIPLMIRSMQRHKDVYIYGKEKVLDFTYIDDCIAALMRGIEKFEQIRNNTVNVGSGKGESLLQVAELIRKQLRSKSRIIIKPARQGEVIRYVADICKAQELLSYQPSFSLRDGLSAAIQWYAQGKYKTR